MAYQDMGEPRGGLRMAGAAGMARQDDQTGLLGVQPFPRRIIRIEVKVVQQSFRYR